MANMPSENEYGEFTQLRFIRFPPSVMDDFVVQYSACEGNIPATQSSGKRIYRSERKPCKMAGDEAFNYHH